MIYILLSIIIIGYVLNELSRRYSLSKLYYKRDVKKSRLEENEEFEITTIIENNKLLPVTFLQVIEKLPRELEYRDNVNCEDNGQYKYHKATMLIMPRQRVKRTYKVSISKRGGYFLSNVTLVAGDLLGLSTMSRDLEYSKEIVVYPRSIELSEELVATGSYFGDISVKRWIINDPVLTVGIREYTGMEPQKSVHWPSSLKYGRLMVKSYDFTTDNEVMLVLNLECGKPFWFNIDINAIEKCLSIARTLIDELERLSIPYGITTNIQSDKFNEGKHTMQAGSGKAHYYELLELLGKANYGISSGFEEVIENIQKNPNKSITYIFITPSILREYIDGINNISKNVGRMIMLTLSGENLMELREEILLFTGKEVGNEGNFKH